MWIRCLGTRLFSSIKSLAKSPFAAYLQMINVHPSSSFSIASCPPRVHDVSWRLQHHVKVIFWTHLPPLFIYLFLVFNCTTCVHWSKTCCLLRQNAHLDKVNEPFYAISLKTEVKLPVFGDSVAHLLRFWSSSSFTVCRIKEPRETSTSPAVWSSSR